MLADPRVSHCRSYGIAIAPCHLTRILLSKASLYLCPNSSLFGRGYEPLAYFKLGTSSEVSDSVKCVYNSSAGHPRKSRECWLERCLIPREAHLEGFCRIQALCPQSPLSRHPLIPSTVCTYESGIQGNVNFLIIWEIAHRKQILFSLIHLLIVYNICTSMQNTWMGHGAFFSLFVFN